MQEIQLSNLYKREKNDRDIFQELMPFKVREILLVANVYDSFSINREGQFYDHIFGEYLQLNLYAAPRITSVSSVEEALLKIEQNNYEMVILMAGLDKKAPLDLAQSIKLLHPEVPIMLLVNNNSDLRYFKVEGGRSEHIERVFVWNGNSSVFMAMTKCIEDLMNVENDTSIGEVRVILLVEDSVKYYTRYLPLLYSVVMRQTQDIIHERNLDELQKILAMRARPKIILCTDFESAVEVVDKYKQNLLSVISDVSFEKVGVTDDNAGVDFLKYVKSQVLVPCLMQSSSVENARKAEELDVEFVDKSSDKLEHELMEFLKVKCGFGDFVFKNNRGIEVDKASNLDQFEEKLKTIPPESLVYHGKRQGISKWLMARGEITLAKRLNQVHLNDFQSTTAMRLYIINAFEENRLFKLRGRTVGFDPKQFKNHHFIQRMGKGSAGGKGRGMAFISHFLENIEFKGLFDGINVRIPNTVIIGVDEFSKFLEINDLYDTIYHEQDYEVIRGKFLKSDLSSHLQYQLKQLIHESDKPLAVRSSGLFEDSLLQPFAGVYATYLLPNNCEFANRFKQLSDAIKLVYASIYSDSSKQYFNAVNHKIEEEKMAVIIQEVVGQNNHNRFYPHISGVAQSYNYYPFAYMKPDDGFSIAAVGLGMYVVGGEKSYRFCPNYPQLELQSVQDIVKESQNYFYAIDLKNTHPNLLDEGEDATILKLPIAEAEEDGNLRHCAQVYDYENAMLVNNFTKRGPRVVNFANILKYDYAPLASTLSKLLTLFTQAMGAPVEIEYAVDLEPEDSIIPDFYVLQIKPLIQKTFDIDVDIDSVDTENALLVAHKGMGNGICDTITDVVIQKMDDFNKTKTKLMAKEVKILNKKLNEEDREYVLIGPGRWGSRDQFTGIPVLWSHISRAKVIIEVGLPEFPLEASLGSHFFHNVTSMNVGYFSIPYGSSTNKLNTEVLQYAELIEETSYFKHLRFKSPINIIMDGKKQIAVITV